MFRIHTSQSAELQEGLDDPLRSSYCEALRADAHRAGIDDAVLLSRIRAGVSRARSVDAQSDFAFNTIVALTVFHDPQLWTDPTVVAIMGTPRWPLDTKLRFIATQLLSEPS